MIRSIFLALSGFGLVFGIIINAKTADLYKGDAHHAIGWVATGMVAVHALIDVLLRFMERPKTNRSEAAESAGYSFRPLINTVHQIMVSRWYGVSGQVSGASCANSGLDVPYVSLHHSAGECERPVSDDHYDDDDDKGGDEYKSLVPNWRRFPRSHSVRKDFFNRSGLPRVFKFFHKTIDWTILVVGYVTLVTGGVTYTGIFVSER